jgi:predicted Zn-dependent peptidase
MAIEYHKHVFDNGLRVYITPMDSATSVTVVIGVGVGARWEQPEVNGVAHFAEHMFFKGTERRPTTRDISSLLDGLGAQFNAFTAEEMTAYYTRTAPEHYRIGLDVLTDMLFHSKFDPDEIEREKGTIIQEIRMYDDQPMALAPRTFQELMYPNHPLGRPVLGTDETIQAMSRQTFMDYLAMAYHTGSMVVSIAGKVDEQEVLGEVEKWMAGLPGGAAPKPIPATGVQPGGRVKLYTKDTGQAHLVLGVPSFPIGHPDEAALSVLNTVLGGTMSSRLFIEVREKQGLCYYVGSSPDPYTDTGMFIARGGMDLNRLDQALLSIRKEMLGMAEAPISDEELTMGKEGLKGRILLGLEGSAGVAMDAVRQELLRGRVRTPDDRRAEVEAVTKEDIFRVANTLFAPERLHLAMCGPFDDPSHFEPLLLEGSPAVAAD